MAPASSARETMIGSLCMLSTMMRACGIVRADAADQRQAAEPAALHRQVDDHDLRAGGGGRAGSLRRRRGPRARASTPASSSMRRQPWSTIGWSSMMRTLVMPAHRRRHRPQATARLPCSSERNGDAHAGAAAGRALDREAAAQTLDALLHAANAETGRRAGGRPAAVVAHAEFELRLVFGLPELRRSLFCACACRMALVRLSCTQRKTVRSIEFAVAAAHIFGGEGECHLRVLA